jgi:DNA invertase Pin-like site-specific DNA recombinase
MKLLYCRVSTEQQNESRQVELAAKLGIEDENIYIDKKSGKNTDREQFKALMAFCRKGDTIYVESISRIARNTKDLLNIVEELQRKQVEFVSLKENIDTSTPQGKFMLTVFGALAELERDCLLQRQAEGIEIAKAEGKYKGRKPKAIDKDAFVKWCSEWRQGNCTAKSIQKRFDISAQTFYRWVKEQQL